MHPVKFALYSLGGTPRSHWIAEPRALPSPALEPTVGHHVVILDRSGSMYGSIAELKVLVEKLFTVQEFADAGQLVSLISYSSSGDVTVHVERTPVAEIMAPGSKHVEAIRSIRATCLTCVSQALDVAKRMVRPGETTAISVHSDGFFNDRSVFDEFRRIDQFIAEMRPVKNVLVNTVAYGWADFGILSKLANALSGSCIKAGSVRDVYNALHDTSKLLAGRVSPASTATIGDADYQALVSVKGRRINGTTTDLTIRGLRPEDDATTWRYRRVSAEAWAASTAPVAGGEQGYGQTWDTCAPIYAFIRAKLAEGRINEAKYALVATRNATLLRAHAKALTAEHLAAFALDVEARLYREGPEPRDEYTTTCGLSAETPITALCALLGAHTQDFTVDLLALTARYAKRGVKRLSGSWQVVLAEDGTPTDRQRFVPAPYKLVPTDSPLQVRVSSFDLNNETATINMLTNRPAKIVEVATGTAVAEAAGVKLDDGSIRAFNNYTLVGDGAVNAPLLPIRVAKKALFDKLAAMGVVSGEYDPKEVYSIDLAAMPVLPYEQDFAPPVGVFRALADLKVLSSLLGASLPGGAAAVAYTDEQKDALRAVGLTPALYFSVPTTSPWTVKDDAIREGLVDSRPAYSVSLGDDEIHSLGELYSANEYLRRRFVVTDTDGVEIEKPTIVNALAQGATIAVKTLSARTKLNTVDAQMMPIFEWALNKGAVESAPGKWGKAPRLATAEERAEAKRRIDAEIERLYAEVVRPLAFYIGATGLVPDAWAPLGADRAYTAEQLAERFPSLSVPKKVRESGLFYVLDKVPGSGVIVLTLSAENADFSTPLGVEAAKSIQADTEAA